MLTQTISLTPSFPTVPTDLRYVVQGDDLAGFSHQRQAADVAANISFFYGIVTGQSAALGFSKVALVGANNAFTGANSFAGATTFAGASTFSGATSFTGPVSLVGLANVPHGSTFTLHGTLEVESDGTIKVDGGGSIQVDGALNVGESGGGAAGTLDVYSTSAVTFHQNSTFDVYGTQSLRSGSTLAVLGGATVTIATAAAEITSTGKLTVDDGGKIVLMGVAGLDVGDGAVAASLRVRASSTLDIFGALTLEASAITTFANNPHFTGSPEFDGANVTLDNATNVFDFSTTTREGPTIMSGATAYVGGRAEFTIDATADAMIDVWNYEVAFLQSTLTGNRILKLNNPPGNARIPFLVRIGQGQLSTFHIDIEDASSAVIIRFNGITSSLYGWALLRFKAAGGWAIQHAGRIDLSGSPITI